MTITKQNSAHTRYIFEAVESIRLARAAELQFEHGNASKLYDTAIHLFIAGVCIAILNAACSLKN
jgi:hypothetical protein